MQISIQQENAVQQCARIKKLFDLASGRISVPLKVDFMWNVDRQWKTQSADLALDFATQHPLAELEQFAFKTQEGNHNLLVMERQAGQVVDKITLSKYGLVDFEEFLSCVEQCFEATTVSQAILQKLPTEISTQIQQFQLVRNALDTNAARISGILTDHVREALERDVEANTRLEERLREQSEKLETQYREKQMLLDGREAAIASKETEQKLKEHRGVRRTLLQDLLASLKKPIEHSKLTTNEARWVRGAFLAALVVALVVMAVSVNVISLQLASSGRMTIPEAVNKTLHFDGTVDEHVMKREATELRLFYYFPFATSWLFFISTLVFFLTWLRSNHKASMNHDLEKVRLEYDMHRASWLAELILEAKNPTRPGAEEFDIPESLLNQLSYRLFERRDSSKADHPIEELQRYAKQFKRLSVGPVTIESKERQDERE